MAIKLLPDLETQKRIADATEEIASKLVGGSYININYADLVALRNLNNLKKGALYRIMDYETTTVQEGTRSAGHQFDIIVQALDEKTLSEDARALLHEGDTYFANSRLEAWKLKYCLDNDTDRFAWADNENGKGVIYRMIDEFNNDVAYDFKNIQFLRDGVYYFTFTWITEDDKIWDASIHPELTDDEGKGSRVFNNTIPLAKEYNNLYILNNNVFIADYDTDDGIFYGWYWNIAKDYFVGNTFGDGCLYNTIGNWFSSNTIGNWFSSNTIGNWFSSNTIGNWFRDNTIGNWFSSNTIGNWFSNNTIGNWFSSNTIGNWFSSNTIGNWFRDNTIGNYFRYNTVDEEVRYIQFSVDGTYNNQIRYLYLKSGLIGASSNNRLDLYYAGLYGREYTTTFEIIANGNIISSWESTPLTRTGKVKATKTTATWSDI